MSSLEGIGMVDVDGEPIRDCGHYVQRGTHDILVERPARSLMTAAVSTTAMEVDT